MSENNKGKCLPWILLGLLGLFLLGIFANYFGANNAKAMANRAQDTAKEALTIGKYRFASANLEGADIVISGTALDQASKKAACDAVIAGLKTKKMLGLPGVVRAVRCEIAAPGDAIIQKQIPAPTKEQPKVQEVAQANSIDINSCQTELNTAAQSGIVGFAKSRGDIETGKDVLDKVSEIAKKCASYKIEVGGHTDSGGDAGMNMRLSQTRAAAVREYLIAKGVSETQLTAKGYGETKPLVDDHAVIGIDNPDRVKNRRTEFTILSQ